MKNFKTPSLLAESIAKHIKKSIISGRLKQGDRLRETHLQSMFGVSRSPIREALRSLEKEGLVVILPRRGAFVGRITEQELREMIVVRARLESLAARLAVPRMGSANIRKMEMLLERMELEIDRSDIASFTRTHHSFHGEFIAVCGNKFLRNTLDRIREQYFRTSISKVYLERFGKKAVDLHRVIVDPLKGEDPFLAEKVVEKHILDFLDVN